MIKSVWNFRKNQIYILLTLLFAGWLTAGCGEEKTGGHYLLTLLPTSVTHVDFENHLKETEKFNIIQYLYFNNGAGVAAGDINNDGLIDLYFTSNQNPNKLYLNKGGLVFEDITLQAGVAGKGDWKTGITMADVNGDNLLDIYVCQVGGYKGLKGRNQLFINNGDLTFEDKAHEYGLDFKGFSTQAAFFDYDLDGDLDMYLLNHSVHTSRSYGGASLREEYDPRAGDRLYRQDEKNGVPVFHDVSSKAGIYSSQIGYGLGVNISDINNDGFPDIYISNDFHENDYLYINNGNSTFTEHLTDMIAHTSRSSMGNDIGDINNDGLLDILVLDMLPDEEKILKQSGGEDDYELFELKRKYGYYYQFVRNTLQLNLGGGLFSEIGRLAGIYATDWSWSPLFCDIDNDGWKDIFITNGIYRRANDLDYVKFLTGGNRYGEALNNKNLPDKALYEKMPLYPNINYIFRNNGDLTFTNMAKTWGFEVRSYSNGSTYADLDNDGDLDLIVNNINDRAFVYRNEADKISGNHYLNVVLKGKGMNMRAIGARVTVYVNGQKMIAEQFPTRGFMSATSDVLHFGLGRAEKVDSIVVRWPDRSAYKLRDVAVDRVLSLDISDGKRYAKGVPEKVDAAKLFSPAALKGLVYKHEENTFVDFKSERLVPHNLSAEGPPIVVGDMNGDGLEDLFIGGARGQEGLVFIQQKDMSFVRLDQPVLAHDRIMEDVDAALFDADGDGDLDLYIVHGGNEEHAGNPLLADRLLLNNGKGTFEKSSRGAVPYMANNGSCVRPCDFDGDGNTDLFVGSRSVPGAYGLSPPSFLLRGDGSGRFSNVSYKLPDEGKELGMVTDACWFDYDGDGDRDLAVTGEWMNLTIFENEKGTFSDATERAGLGQTSGWWNCIEVADLDGDGDEDLVAGNLGLNSILKASPEKPVEMYVNDFDRNGSLDQIICAYQDGISYPVASFDELAGQIPALKKKYKNYSDFGGQTVTDIFGEKKVGQSILKNAVQLKSCIFLNEGDAGFKVVPLPVYAQFSPVRDILIRDFNGDGKEDIVLAGNDYAVRPSLGRYDASYGWFLAGDGGINFKTKMPEESGLTIKGDARFVRVIRVGKEYYLLATVNDGPLQILGF